MKQTAMQQLKEKIQAVIGEMNGELSSYESGYKQCLINIQNDIDLQMLAMEKEQIVNAFKEGLRSPYHQDYAIVTQEGQEATKSGQYYNETYGKQ